MESTSFTRIPSTRWESTLGNDMHHSHFSIGSYPGGALCPWDDRTLSQSAMRYTTEGTIHHCLWEAMLHQVYGSPKLRLPQAKDARVKGSDHSVQKFTKRLPMQEGCCQIRGSQCPRRGGYGRVSPGGSTMPLLNAEEEAPRDHQLIAYHALSPPPTHTPRNLNVGT